MKDFMLRIVKGKEIIFIDMLICMGIFVLLLPLMFFNYKAYVTGWLLGILISFICFLSLFRFSDAILKGGKKAWINVFVFMGRFLLYGGGLLLAGFTTYYWKIDLFNIFMVFAGYMVPFLIGIVIYLLRSKNGRSA